MINDQLSFIRLVCTKVFASIIGQQNGIEKRRRKERAKQKKRKKKTKTAHRMTTYEHNTQTK